MIMAMNQGFSLNQTQSQKLALTQGMRQSIAMLRLDALDLQDYLQEISLENPLINVKMPMMAPVATSSPSSGESYQIKDTHGSLFAYLLDQVHLTMRKTPLRALVIYLISQLEPSGYLPLSDEEILKQVAVSPIMLLDAKTLLQRLDPPGVGAHDLQECLLLQAENDADAAPAAAEILRDHFQALKDHRWTAIQKKLDLTDQQFATAMNYIQSLSANPGLPYNHTATSYVIPELRVTTRGGKLSLQIIQHNQPQVVFAEETYDQLKQSTDAEVAEYIQDRYTQYQTIVYNIQRRTDTLMMVGRQIVQAQYAFFTQQKKTIAPLLLRDIAQKLQISESTVSRAINDKYIETGFGVFPLKDFFSRYSGGDEGADRSVDQMTDALQKLVAAEDPAAPLSDEQLAAALQAQGYQVARRTVAKYRKEKHIPSSAQRRRNAKLKG
ncbi:RNA polymerase factor sigma-54 [Schleiferilactobacillus harbinensis]|uniref:RNA polymerase factor sigma-54 n=2 Tax=Schleiferilactobacillus harbinensis TaxID=304207 RepID=A0A5P8M856_9LACO|nr:RNA polymerase factor sigma-54 [Schleiferilactobacillus harbinensis]